MYIHVRADKLAYLYLFILSKNISNFTGDSVVPRVETEFEKIVEEVISINNVSSVIETSTSALAKVNVLVRAFIGFVLTEVNAYLLQ